MTAKEYLSQARILDKLIEADIHELERLRALSTSLGTQDYSQERVQSSGSGDKLCEIVTKIVDLQNKVNDEIDRYIDLKNELRNVICAIKPDKERLILKMRYICGASWDEIADHMGCSNRWVLKKHGEALKKVSVVHISSL